MPNLTGYTTAHQLAQELLAGPDHTVVTLVPGYDAPTGSAACAVRTQVVKIENVDVVALLPWVPELGHERH